MGGAADQTLAHAHQLARAARVHAPLAGAVFAGDLADARVDAEPAQRGRDQLGEFGEARVDAVAGCCGGNRPGEGERLGVEHGGAAAGEPQHRHEAERARRGDGGVEAGRGRVDAREREHVVGAVEPERLGRCAARDLVEQRARERGVEGGPTGEADLEQVNATHAANPSGLGWRVARR